MRRARTTLFVAVAGVGLIVAAAAFAAVALTREVPPVSVITARLPRAVQKPALRFAWPAQGQAAVAVPGVGLVRSGDSAPPQPIASVAKVMTALIVLRDHPLGAGQSGPEVQVTPQDVATYRADMKAGQSTVVVAPGEELSERQALEGLLLPSGNNLATLLAKWDAGTESAFVDKMNAEARTLGMTDTHYADASGFDPATVSTALDQVRLASVALRTPALAQIAALPQAQLPVAGAVRNLDALLGADGVLGGKTGNTSAAGGCFVFLARIPAGGRTLAVLGAVLGQPGVGEFAALDSAFDAARALVASARPGPVSLRAVLHRRRVGMLTSAWERPVAIWLGRIPNLIGWSGVPFRMRIVAPRHLHAPIRAGQVVGALVVRIGPQRASIPLVSGRALAKPTLGWRITHP
jgi:D-alanyl-D-alanine carboxypeptidase (penicillin-binding protein 5/6)